MDGDVQRRVGATRWLAWAVAGLLVSGAVSVGAVRSRDDAGDEAIATATSAPVDTSTSSTIPPEPVGPPTTVAVTTTAVERPVRATTTTVKRTTTTTARPPQATTTVPPATTTTAPAVHGGTKATVTVANDYAHAVTLTLSGREFVLAPGQQQGPFEHIIEPNGNDSVGIRLVAQPECGLGDAGLIFPGAGRWRLAVVAGPGSCLGSGGTPFAGPNFRVTPA